MEQYLALLILLFPGYLAKETARYLGNARTSRKSNLTETFEYLTYSAFSLFPFFLWEIEPLWKEFLVAILGGVIFGSFWGLLGNRLALKIAHSITSNTTGFYIDPGINVLEATLNDGESHFLKLERDGKVLAIGFFERASDAEDRDFQIQVISHPIYTEWLTREDTKDYFIERFRTLDATNNFILTEYWYPDWIDPKVLNPNSEEALTAFSSE